MSARRHGNPNPFFLLSAIKTALINGGTITGETPVKRPLSGARDGWGGETGGIGPAGLNADSRPAVGNPSAAALLT